MKGYDYRDFKDRGEDIVKVELYKGGKSGEGKFDEVCIYDELCYNGRVLNEIYVFKNVGYVRCFVFYCVCRNCCCEY